MVDDFVAGLPIQDIVRAPIFLVLYLVLLLLAKWFKGLAISYKINQQWSGGGNLAVQASAMLLGLLPGDKR